MATLSEVNRHDRIVEAWGNLLDLLQEYDYELRADLFEGDVDIDVHRKHGDHLFTIDTIDRVTG